MRNTDYGNKSIWSRRIFLLVLELIILSTPAVFAAPSIEWTKSLGGSKRDFAKSIQQTSDGGYIVAGFSESNDGDISGNHGESDYWVLKLTEDGMLEWQKSLGGSKFEGAFSAQETVDGGYIISGSSYSNDGDVSGNHGDVDYWIVKLNASGEILWQKSLGGTGMDNDSFIRQTADGGYIIAGSSRSNDGDVSGNHGDLDYWVVKIDQEGEIVWEKSLGGSKRDDVSTIPQIMNDNYLIAGISRSNDGDVLINHGRIDYWVVQLDTAGKVIFQKSFGGSQFDSLYSTCLTSDGGYILAGSSNSKDGDVLQNHGSDDYWIIKLNFEGNIVWEKSLGGSKGDAAYSVQQTDDGGYIVAGSSVSSDGEVSENHGEADCWIMKLDSDGNIKWDKSFGGSRNDVAYAICQTRDGGYVFAGYSESKDDDVPENQGKEDFWVVKLNPELSR